MRYYFGMSAVGTSCLLTIVVVVGVGAKSLAGVGMPDAQSGIGELMVWSNWGGVDYA